MHIQNLSAQPLPLTTKYDTLNLSGTQNHAYLVCPLYKSTKDAKKAFFFNWAKYWVDSETTWFLLEVPYMRQLVCPQTCLNKYSLLSLQIWLLEVYREALIFLAGRAATQTLLTHLGKDPHVPLPLGL